MKVTDPEMKNWYHFSYANVWYGGNRGNPTFITTTIIFCFTVSELKEANFYRSLRTPTIFYRGWFKLRYFLPGMIHTQVFFAIHIFCHPFFCHFLPSIFLPSINFSGDHYIFTGGASSFWNFAGDSNFLLRNRLWNELWTGDDENKTGDPRWYIFLPGLSPVAFLSGWKLPGHLAGVCVCWIQRKQINGKFQYKRMYLELK